MLNKTSSTILGYPIVLFIVFLSCTLANLPALGQDDPPKIKRTRWYSHTGSYRNGTVQILDHPSNFFFEQYDRKGNLIAELESRDSLLQDTVSCVLYDYDSVNRLLSRRTISQDPNSPSYILDHFVENKIRADSGKYSKDSVGSPNSRYVRFQSENGDTSFTEFHKDGKLVWKYTIATTYMPKGKKIIYQKTRSFEDDMKAFFDDETITLFKDNRALLETDLITNKIRKYHYSPEGNLSSIKVKRPSKYDHCTYFEYDQYGSIILKAEVTCKNGDFGSIEVYTHEYYDN